MLNAYQLNVWRDFRLPMSALVMKAEKRFNGKFTAKKYFPIECFILPLLQVVKITPNMANPISLKID